MNYYPIDFEKVKSNLPLFTRVFGEADLERQIGLFNNAISGKSLELGKFRFIKELDNKTAVHHKIINILSYLSNPNKEFPFSFTASLFYLESLLSNLENQLNINSYRDLIRSPNSFENAIAELTIANKFLSTGNSISIHNQSKKHVSLNYDLLVNLSDNQLHADIKWFKSSLSKDVGLSMPHVFEDLIIDDIDHWIMVKLKDHIYNEDDAVQAAFEVIELYNEKDSTSSDIAYIGKLGDKSKSITFKYGKGEFIENISIIDIPGEPMISTMGGFNMTLDVKDAITRNIQKGARQVEGNINSTDLQTIFLGTNNTHESHDVEYCLYHIKNQFGDPSGLFKEGPQNLKELSSVVFFSINYKIEDENRYRVVLDSKFFPNPENNNHLEMEKVYEQFQSSLSSKVIKVNF